MGGRDHSCEGCGRGGFNDPDGECVCPVPANDLPERLRALRDAKDAGLGTEGFLLDQPDRDLLTEAAEAIEEAQPRYLRAAASFQQERDEARRQRDGAEEQWRRWVEIAEAAEAERDRLRGAITEHKARIIAGPVNQDYPEDYEESADEQLWAALSSSTPVEAGATGSPPLSRIRRR